MLTEEKLKSVTQRTLGMSGVIRMQQALVHAQRNSWIEEEWIRDIERFAKAIVEAINE